MVSNIADRVLDDHWDRRIPVDMEVIALRVGLDLRDVVKGESNVLLARDVGFYLFGNKCHASFESDLLIPSEALMYYINELGVSDVFALSKIFAVPAKLMYQRLKDSDLIS